MSSMTKQQSREQAKARLLEWLKPGDTVYTILRHRSRSGMSREIGVVVPLVRASEVDFVHPNYAVADLLGLRLSKDRDAVIVHGAGMDMGFHLVERLSYALFGDGSKLRQRWL